MYNLCIINAWFMYDLGTIYVWFMFDFPLSHAGDMMSISSTFSLQPR